ncbi:hypothetical protein DBR39_13565 [Chryseobacterium sp. KBW03]|uniref:hypothetical protein n=1 Tax=Chryseobacterium sp. KBW03 TaxID=2153362 RepID=UPI000F5B18AD|nr:hypothetical protein [Chryseobacterium sp. KBW03]RQO37911.1 hypothetical protein DBR39_13565 [Chryseobacterium sp. KBW03]
MKPLKALSDLLPIPSYTVIILCFFFPFFLIKCGDTTLMSVKGTDLVTGVSKKAINERMKESLKKSSPFGAAFGNDKAEADTSSDTDIEYSPLNEPKDKKDHQNISPNPFIIITLLAAIAGIVVQVMKNIRKKYLYHIILSIIGLASLLIFYLTFQSNMEGFGNNKMAMGFGSDISISYGFGTAFYLCAVLYLFVLLFYGVFSYFLKNDPQAIYGSTKQNTES